MEALLFSETSDHVNTKQGRNPK